MPEKEPRRPQRPGRPQTPPPALLSAGEPFEGYQVLAEIPREAGVVLWATVRDVVLWTKATGPRRSDLFSKRAYRRAIEELMRTEMDDALRPQVMILSEVLKGEQKTASNEIAQANLKVSSWAEENRLPKTAIAYAQAAALTVPENAEYAFIVGRLCRRNTQLGRAETWYRRAIGLARRQRDSRSYARSWMGLGNIYLTRGNHLLAQKAFERAFRRARRAGIKDIRAEALHDLFGAAVESRRIVDAEVFARKAAKAYGPSHLRLPVLAHDVAGFWLSQGFFERSLSVFQAVLPLIRLPSERLQVLGSIARAAGGARKQIPFANAWMDAWHIIDGDPETECISHSLLNLAYGSAYFGDWERVELAATVSLQLAIERKAEQVRLEAEALLEALSERRFSDSFLPSPADPAVIEAADALAGEFVRKLAVCAGATGNHPRIRC